MIPQNQNIGKGYKHEDRGATQRALRSPSVCHSPLKSFSREKKWKHKLFVFKQSWNEHRNREELTDLAKKLQNCLKYISTVKRVCFTVCSISQRRKIKSFFLLFNLLWQLKGQCHEIFDPVFSMIPANLGPFLICRNIFAYCFDFAEIFVGANKSAVSLTPGVRLCGVNDPQSVNQVFFTPHCQALLCNWHHWAKLRYVIDTTESNSTVSLTPLSQTPQYHWHHWVKLHGIIDTAESNSTVSLILLSLTSKCWHRRVLNVITESVQFLPWLKKFKNLNVVLPSGHHSWKGQCQEMFTPYVFGQTNPFWLWLSC